MAATPRMITFRFSAMAFFALALSQARGADTLPIPSPKWPGDFLARVEILALLETLNADLLGHDSATLTLEHWCATHRLAMPATIAAARMSDVDKPASPDQRQALRVSAAEKIGYRHVRLSCGAVILSEADNWYVPSRLTPAMNKLLETTDTPFGKVVAPLNFQRHTFASTRLWSPLPEHWEMNPPPNDAHTEWTLIPDSLFEHIAILTLPDGTPFSEVLEVYKSGILAFQAPKLRGSE